MAIDTLAEEVALNLEEVAEVTRQIDTARVGFFVGGTVVGIAIGFYFGYRFNREKIRAEAFKESEEEVEKIKEFYRAKTMAAEPKPSLEVAIEEAGYSTRVEAMEEAGYSTEEIENVVERPLRPPVPGVAEPREIDIRDRLAPKRTAAGEKDKSDGWSYPYELSQRSPIEPYIIHQDEFSLNESEYQQTHYTYYAGDDVLTDEDDTVINNRANLVGQDNLTRFGHGSDDFNIVYVRNSQLELEFEISRVPNSYEEEVQGLEPNDSPN